MNMNQNQDQETFTAVDTSLASFKRSAEELLRGKRLAVEALQNHPREAVTNAALMNHVLGMVVDAADDDYSGETVIDPHGALKPALESCFSQDLHPCANIRAHSLTINLHLTLTDPASEAAFVSEAERHGRMIDALLKAFDTGIFNFKVTVSSDCHARTRKVSLSPDGKVKLASWEPTDNPSAASHQALFVENSIEAIRQALPVTESS